jgi:hypothetical protein
LPEPGSPSAPRSTGTSRGDSRTGPFGGWFAQSVT